MNRMSTEKRAHIVACLCEGMSIRATGRITGADKKTILRLLAELGKACREYQDEVLRDLPCKAFCYAKDKNLPEELRNTPGFGSIWTWTAICADTKLVPSFHVGTRDVLLYSMGR
jgi:hypothetical protein